MSEWKKVKLGECCQKIGSGSTPKGGSTVYVESGTSFIRSQNVYNLSFDYNKNIILNVPKKMTLKMPVINGTGISFNLSSGYAINNTSKYRYQLAVNYNSAWNKYPYYEDADFTNNYTTNKIFQLDTDCNKRSYDINKVSKVYARVINLETGEYSQWAMYQK